MAPDVAVEAGSGSNVHHVDFRPVAVEATPPGFRIDGGEVMTAEEVAGELRLSTKTVYRLTQSGRIPFVPLGRAKRYLRSELMKFLREGGTSAKPNTTPKRRR